MRERHPPVPLETAERVKAVGAVGGDTGGDVFFNDAGASHRSPLSKIHGSNLCEPLLARDAKHDRPGNRLQPAPRSAPKGSLRPSKQYHFPYLSPVYLLRNELSGSQLTRLLDPGAAPAFPGDQFAGEYRAGAPGRIRSAAIELAIRAKIIGAGRFVYVRQCLGLGIVRIHLRHVRGTNRSAGQKNRRAEGDNSRGRHYKLTTA